LDKAIGGFLKPCLVLDLIDQILVNLCINMSYSRPGMTPGEELWGQFYTGDRDRDLAWDIEEWIHHLNNNTERRKSDKMR